MKFKVGDKVKCVYNDNGTPNYVGDIFTIDQVTQGMSSHPYYCSRFMAWFCDQELELINNNSYMSSKFYRAVQDNPGITKGAIIEKAQGSSIYAPVSDLYHQEAIPDGEKVVFADFADFVVEKNPQWFEKVYPVNLLTKTVYKLKSEALDAINKEYNA